MLHITTFGGLQIERDGPPLDLPSRTARHLLAYLILHHDRSLARDLLAGTFWPDRSNALARRALSQALWQIRTALGPSADRVVAEPEHVTFTLQPGDRLDVTDFETAIRSDDPAQLREAVALYQADFLEGCYADWALLERERLREQYLAALERLVVLHKRRGDFEAALQLAQQLVAADPLRETAHQECMRLYHLLDRSRAALAQYQALCEILAEEMDAEPLPRTAQLAREIAAALATDAPSHLPFPTPEAPALEQTSALPLVGREAERAALLAHLERAIGGQGTLVLIEGEAGVGKTRLLDALAEGADWREVPVCRGRGRELTGALPYGVLREALRQALTPLRISQILRLLEPTWLQEASRVLPTLAERLPALPPPPKLGPDQQRQRLVEGLYRLVLALGEVTPHVLILDDLQWADESTLAVLHSLVQRLSESRVLIVGAYRSAEARARPELWEALQALDRAGEHPRLLLARLTVEQTGELVRRGLGLIDQAPRFERRLYQETAGNPLFVLETLRALHDEGLLYRDEDGDWSTPWDQAASGYTAMPLPSGVQEIIGQRIARLDADEFALLEGASVLGDAFDFDLLARTQPLPEARLLDVVDGLVRRQLLIEAPEVYRFSHDKVQEVVYAGIEASRRRALHRQVGETLVRHRPEEMDPLAYHFWHGEQWEQAWVFNHRAARRAWAVYAGATAFDAYGRAIVAWERLPDAEPALGARLHEERGRLCQEIGRFDQAGADFEAALALAREAGDAAAQARALNGASHLHFQQSEYKEAIETARQALALARTVAATDQIAQGFFNQANAVRNQGHYQDAIPLYERAIALYKRLHDTTRLADALNRMGAALFRLGRYAEAHAAITRALATRRRLDDRVGISYSLINLAVLEFHRGHFTACQAAAQEAVDISRAIGNPYGEDAALCELGRARLEQGSPVQALGLLRESLRIGEEIGDHSLASTVLCWMGVAHHRRGDLEQARALLIRGLETAREVDKADVPVACARLAELLLDVDEPDEALRHVETGLQVAGEIHDLWSQGVFRRLLGQITAKRGRAAVRVHFEASIRLLTELGAEAELARSQAAYGLYWARLDDAEEARKGAALIETARTAFAGLNMSHDLRRLDAAQADYLPPGRARVRLASVDAPTGRPLEASDYVTVTWTLSSDEEDAATQRFPAWRADLACRRHRLLRLLDEAEAQSAAPTVHDLAEALDVSARTIERDLAALRDAGYEVRTRGTRS